MNRVFYDNVSGEPILHIQPQNDMLDSIERNIEQFTILSERNRETFEYIDFDFLQYIQSFTESIGYRINIETRELEFRYQNLDEPEEEIEFEQPLTSQIMELRAQFMYDSMIKDSAIEEILGSQALLTYILMEKGII